jgi:hypothetical protein
VSTEDHNKTLIILHSAIAAFYTLGLVALPWVIAKNFSHREQVPLAIVISGLVFLMALLFWSTAIAMYRRKSFGRKLALVAAVASLPLGWPIGVYTWWFMHSDGAKRLYQRGL